MKNTYITIARENRLLYVTISNSRICCYIIIIINFPFWGKWVHHNLTRAPEFTTGLSGARVTQSVVFDVVIGRSLFDRLSFPMLVIVLSVLPFTASEYRIGIFNILWMKSLKRPTIEFSCWRGCLPKRKIRN
jgi:hypothetical protein